MDMLHEVSQFCQPTLHTLLFGNMALTDEANENQFLNMYISLFKEANALKSPLELSYKLTYINTNFHIASNIIYCLNIV